jgi:hypothetical protein
MSLAKDGDAKDRNAKRAKRHAGFAARPPWPASSLY